MIQVDYYKAGDSDLIEPLYNYVEASDMNHMFKQASSFTFRSRRSSANPLAIVGAMSSWKGVAWVMVLLGKEYPKYRRELDNEFRVLLQIYGSANDINKYYSLIDSIQEKHIKWAEYFGFSYEYTMLQASPDQQDLLGYSLTF